MEIKELIARKKEILEYVFKDHMSDIIITENEDNTTFDVYFKSKCKDLIIRYDKEIDEVRLQITDITMIIDTSEFLKITII